MISSELVRAEAPVTAGSQATRERLSGGPPLLVIEPTSGWRALNLRELWRYRELLGFLTWRDVKIRYKQTALGAVWAILQPAMTMVVFTLFFGRGAGMAEKVHDISYPLFVYAGLLPWLFFSTSITTAGTSLVNNQNLVSKIYFPRLMIPLSSVGAAFVDLSIAFLLLVGMMPFYGRGPGLGIVLLPVVLVLMTLLTVGVGAILAGLTVAYRDFRYVVPFLTQMWMFVTPIMYPASIVRPELRWLWGFNPMSGVVETFRYCVLDWPADWTPWTLLMSAVMTIGIFFVGIFYFRQVERGFADVV
jgi:lipopolysaccharide transport system permease protein